MSEGQDRDVDQEHIVEQRHLAREHAQLRLHQFRIVGRNLEQRSKSFAQSSCSRAFAPSLGKRDASGSRARRDGGAPSDESPRDKARPANGRLSGEHAGFRAGSTEGFMPLDVDRIRRQAVGRHVAWGTAKKEFIFNGVQPSRDNERRSWREERRANRPMGGGAPQGERRSLRREGAAGRALSRQSSASRGRLPAWPSRIGGEK